MFNNSINTRTHNYISSYNSSISFLLNKYNYKNTIYISVDVEIERIIDKNGILKDLPIKGDTIIGNDVWIGQNATNFALVLVN